ncbi:hypothetical protein [Gloeocapsopsis dulcis]|nr:hypothetical protein [Gloeocapsopsis dulcis]WNN88769.1 hypothetical protein P0S91_21250 [Gloeocapsopsis dulcis]
MTKKERGIQAPSFRREEKKKIGWRVPSTNIQGFNIQVPPLSAGRD